MAKLILQIATIAAITKATEKSGLLPIDAEEGDKIAVSIEDIQQLERENKIGAIKGLIFAGNGRIFQSYTCVKAASAKDARRIKYTKDGVDQELAVPTWKPGKGAEPFVTETAGPASAQIPGTATQPEPVNSF